MCDLFITGQGRMVAFDFKQNEKTLDQAGLLSDDMQAAFVRNLKTNPCGMVWYNFSECNLTSGTPLRLSDILRVMVNRWIDKEMQCSNWTMYNSLSQKMRDYGAFDAYVIQYVRNIVDQRLRAVCASFYGTVKHFF